MVSKEYAKAIFEIALENNKEDKYLELLKMVLKTLDKNEDFKKILNSPFISEDEKNNLLINVFKGIDEDFIHFLLAKESFVPRFPVGYDPGEQVTDNFRIFSLSKEPLHKSPQATGCTEKQKSL